TFKCGMRSAECGILSGPRPECRVACNGVNGRKKSETPHVVSCRILKLFCSVVVSVAAGVLQGIAAGAGTNGFGFLGPEIFPIENQISQLRVADLDGDGLNDIVVVNNARSKINLLYN